MSNKQISLTGIFGVSLFVITSIVGGLLIEGYSFTSQLISESYAIDTEYGLWLRLLGYIPSGILMTIFAFAAIKKLPKSKLTSLGLSGIGLFYGLATVLVAIFPCDSGCNKEFIDPSISQTIHNLSGLLTYILVPISIIIIGIGLKKSLNYKHLSFQGIALGVLSIVFIAVLSSDPVSHFAGLYQRIIESIFMLFIVSCAFTIKKQHI
jgi:hypothetical membrane protein